MELCTARVSSGAHREGNTRNGAATGSVCPHSPAVPPYSPGMGAGAAQMPKGHAGMEGESGLIPPYIQRVFPALTRHWGLISC